MGNESWLKSLYELYGRGIKVGGTIDDRGKVFIIFIVKFKWIESLNMLRRPRDAEGWSCFYVLVVVCFEKRFNVFHCSIVSNRRKNQPYFQGMATPKPIISANWCYLKDITLNCNTTANKWCDHFTILVVLPSTRAFQRVTYKGI